MAYLAESDVNNVSDNGQRLVLKKHVATIHSSNQLTLIQRKIANALLFNAYDNLLTQDEHRIHIRDLCHLIGYRSNDHKTIKLALINLLSTVIQWNLIDKDKLNNQEVWNASSIIADASINGPTCTYSYSNKMRKLLYQPELYGRLNMEVLAKFKSNYGLALYENCIRYQNIKQTPWFDMTTFRVLMGVEEGKYIIFRDFNKRVLSKAIQEVNDHSAILITVKLKRDNAKVSALRFLIEPKITVTQSLNWQRNSEDSLVKRLQDDFGCTPKQIEQLLGKYDRSYVLEKVSVIESSNSYKQGKINNLAGYLESALLNDYRVPRSSQTNVVSISENLQEQKIAKKPVALQLTEEEKRLLNEQLLAKFNQLNEADQSAVLDKFDKYLKPTAYYNLYLRQGLENILVTDQLCHFLLGNDFLNQTFDSFAGCVSVS